MVYFLYPETAGFSLEAVDLTFMDQNKSPVSKADELWTAIRNGRNVTLTGEIVRKETDGQTNHVEVA